MLLREGEWERGWPDAREKDSRPQGLAVEPASLHRCYGVLWSALLVDSLISHVQVGPPCLRCSAEDPLGGCVIWGVTQSPASPRGSDLISFLCFEHPKLAGGPWNLG
jgi:hypothetical protein